MRQPSLVLKAVKNESYRHYLDEAVAMEKLLNLPTVDPSRCAASTPESVLALAEHYSKCSCCFAPDAELSCALLWGDTQSY